MDKTEELLRGIVTSILNMDREDALEWKILLNLAEEAQCLLHERTRAAFNEALEKSVSIPSPPGSVRTLTYPEWD